MSMSINHARLSEGQQQRLVPEQWQAQRQREGQRQNPVGLDMSGPNYYARQTSGSFTYQSSGYPMGDGSHRPPLENGPPPPPSWNSPPFPGESPSAPVGHLNGVFPRVSSPLSPQYQPPPLQSPLQSPVLQSSMQGSSLQQSPLLPLPQQQQQLQSLPPPRQQLQSLPPQVPSNPPVATILSPNISMPAVSSSSSGSTISPTTITAPSQIKDNNDPWSGS